MIIGAEPSDAPARVLTVAGWLSLDDEYVPGVVAGEHVNAHPEAKAALAIAARTYLLRAMRDRPGLGLTTPIPSGEGFQVFAHRASHECMMAAERTRRMVLRHRGRMVLANHVAGAYRTSNGGLGSDPTNTERYVTYNIGRSGTNVIPTRLSLRSHPGNRGCLGQHCAHWMGAQGLDHPTILRVFYGEDIEIHTLVSSGRRAALEPKVMGMMLALVGLMLGRRR
ncbi:SpoIID/LytB domain-containing protein [Polyangium sp. 15x6]|uniref:SpoIID/LytB domain-containing protein n=1 Tax=Polyangium sp. 15x6 TaxID=3042687 RepID=UPI00249B74B6|nr:SpoIID/LytB domain-containing protein [Polyangium sp. 15x6]MDI3291909.1 SpoIID/LytB domain-containing protein [Polyangium sp. 15x6]